MNNSNINNSNEKPFSFWKFMIIILIGLLGIVSLIVGIPYLVWK